MPQSWFKTVQNINDKIITVIIDKVGVNEREISSNTRFIEDLGMDSLDLVELIMEFENEFNITLPDEKAEKIKTVGDAEKYVGENLKGAGKK